MTAMHVAHVVFFLEGPSEQDFLQALCVQAGRPDAVVRIACRELESFLIGDWCAVAQAFGKPALAALDRRSIYRAPDELGDPASELKKHIAGYQKRDGARKIAPHLNIERNRSRSFQVLIRSITEY